MLTVDDLTIEAIPALVTTYEVVDADRRVLGVIAQIDDGDWRVITTRYGAPEPDRKSHPSREAAAQSLLPLRKDP